MFGKVVPNNPLKTSCVTHDFVMRAQNTDVHKTQIKTENTNLSETKTNAVFVLSVV